MVTDMVENAELENAENAEALALIDAQLAVMHAREIVSAADVSDILLDLRLLLQPAPEPEPAVT